LQIEYLWIDAIFLKEFPFFGHPEHRVTDRRAGITDANLVGGKPVSRKRNKISKNRSARNFIETYLELVSS